jgi:hexosaminidase
MKTRLSIALSCALLAACAPSATRGPEADARAVHDRSAYPLIPFPRHLEPRAGWFVLNAESRIEVEGAAPELRAVAERWAEPVRRAAGLPLPVTGAAGAAPANAIRLRIDPQASDNPEGYRLSVTTTAVTLSAPELAGIFYGLQTLRQLLPVEVERARIGQTVAARAANGGPRWAIPAVEIEDAPRFKYRGLHLDVGRHFFPVEFVKKYIDLMALYKFNVFHWHLTEDQGWRLEIKKYPKLTEVGSCRKETMVAKNFNPYVGDGKPYCGYYTQEEAREIVEYARERFVTVIPEIEMPGHSLAALASYPELACTPGPFEVQTRWGVFEDIYCPKEETFAFLQDVLTEVMEIFPSRYIHIGGDEAPKKRWKESPIAQEVIRREGLRDENELQSYFIRRIERFLNSRGRAIIGWDEILEGGLAPNATVMSWRGMAGGIEAAKQRHDVIMVPTSPLYLDYYQGDPRQEPLSIGGYNPIERVYAFEPIPVELTPEEAKHVIGAQGNVWTEYIKTPEHVEYMAYPRALALSEVVWSPKEVRDWADFLERLPAQLSRLGALEVNYRIPEVRGLEKDQLTLEDHVTIELGSLVPGSEIRYTLDGTDPTRTSTLYTGPFRLPVTEEGVVVSARVYRPDGQASIVRRARFARTTYRRAEAVPGDRVRAGLLRATYEGAFRSLDSLRNATPVQTGVVAEATLEPGERGRRRGYRLSGYVRVPADGLYTFRVVARDRSRLSIGGQQVVDHVPRDGAEVGEGQIALRAGYHAIEVWLLETGGLRGLSLEVARAGEEPRPVPASWLFHLPSGGAVQQSGHGPGANDLEPRLGLGTQPAERAGAFAGDPEGGEA